MTARIVSFLSSPLMVLGIITALIFFIFRKGETSGRNTEIIKIEQQQNEIKNEIIETKNFQQKIILVPASPANERADWVHSFYTERETASF